MTVAEAAKAMEATEEFVRAGLRAKVLPFGCAVRMNGRRYRYYISRDAFEAFQRGVAQ